MVQGELVSHTPALHYTWTHTYTYTHIYILNNFTSGHSILACFLHVSKENDFTYLRAQIIWVLLKSRYLVI